VIRLPPLTFLSGPPGCGKSTIADALSKQDSGLCRCSIAEPIRMALLSTFYPDQMTLGIDLRDGAVKASVIPGTGITHRQWMISFSEFMKSLFGKQIFGDLAKRQLELQTMYYDRFVFDDCRFADELRPFINAYGGQNCLIVHINRKDATWGTDPHTSLNEIPGIHHAGINNNSTVEDALSSLAAALDQTYIPPSQIVEPAIDEL
jgi:hypothetical protein